MKKEANMISDWLDQNPNPEIEKFIEKNLAIAEIVNQELRNRDWSQLRFAAEIGKKPSEVSKWLSGMHNLTMKSIIKMEVALGLELIHTEPIKEYEYVFLGKVENRKHLKIKANDYKGDSEMQEYPIAM
ncbi:MAG: helix-turn-helix transcriptional regulator [Bacteroidales bacterium]|jgi:transcriptional regulator with XRE-family HTH domain|nr:helix-turn-helix transcriptional regulator [Bacteroidales bacterium]